MGKCEKDRVLLLREKEEAKQKAKTEKALAKTVSKAKTVKNLLF